MILQQLHDSSEHASNLLRLLSGRIRLRLLARLLERDFSVTNLAKATAHSEQRVSQELAALRAAGLVSRKRHGRRTIYSIAHPAGRQLTQAVLNPLIERELKELT